MMISTPVRARPQVPMPAESTGMTAVVVGAEDRDRSGHLGEAEVLDEAGAEPLECAGLVGRRASGPRRR
jgi:hypothetical protein